MLGFWRNVFWERREADLPEAALLVSVEFVVLELQPTSTRKASAVHQVREHNEVFCINSAGCLGKGFPTVNSRQPYPFQGFGDRCSGKKSPCFKVLPEGQCLGQRGVLLSCDIGSEDPQ